MQLKSVLISLVVIIMSICVLAVVKASGDHMKITKKQAIKIATIEAKRLNYNVESIDLKISKHNTPWNEYLPQNSKSEYDIERQNKLQNREYVAIYYSLKPERKGEIIKGGDLCVFVDLNTGEIITIIRGK